MRIEVTMNFDGYEVSLSDVIDSMLIRLLFLYDGNHYGYEHEDIEEENSHRKSDGGERRERERERERDTGWGRCRMFQS